MKSYAERKGRSSKKKNEFKRFTNGSTYSMLRHDMKMIGLYNKINNGDLSAPLNKAKETFGLSKPGLKKALDELSEADFLEVTRQGGKNQCSLYALTCFPLNDVNKAGISIKATERASDKWKKY